MAAVPPQPREVIDLTDSDTMDDSDDEAPHRPRCLSAQIQPHSPVTQNPAQKAVTRAEAFQDCLLKMLAVFPDISHDHVQRIFDKPDWGVLVEPRVLHQAMIEDILDAGAYPKERDRLKELKKRKRASPEAEAAKWKYKDLRHDPVEYAKVAKARLSERFPWVPTKFINDTFKEHAHYYGSFFAIDKADRGCDLSKDATYQRLKSRRTSNSVKSEQLMASLAASGHDFTDLKEEISSAETRWQKEEEDRKVAKQSRIAKEAIDEDYRRKGETMECACCFDDEVIPTNVTHCNAEVPHLFCFACAKRNAENDMTSLKYALRCMDGSHCEATFSREERAKFLDAATIEKLERLQQQDELRRAELDDLENCPFCDFAAICPPVHVDRVFECQNPECMDASCRLCKEKSHIPLTCAEAKKENGIGERHAIEEARTEALVRSCKRCKVRILKEDGCNKVICTNCYSIICDYCGEDISKAKYEHFDGEGRGAPFGLSGKGKCPLYDTSSKRKEEQIEKAGKVAEAKIRKENPGVSEEDLKIKFAKVVEDQGKTHRGIPDMPVYRAGAHRPHRRGLQAEPPEVAAEVPFDHLQAHRQRMLQIEAQQQEVDQRMANLRQAQRLGENHNHRHHDYGVGALLDPRPGRNQLPPPPFAQFLNGGVEMERDQHLPAHRPGYIAPIDWQYQADFRGNGPFIHGVAGGEYALEGARLDRIMMPDAGRHGSIGGRPHLGFGGVFERGPARLDQLEGGAAARGALHRDQRSEINGTAQPGMWLDVPRQDQELDVNEGRGLLATHLRDQQRRSRLDGQLVDRLSSNDSLRAAQQPLPQPAPRQMQGKHVVDSELTSRVGAKPAYHAEHYHPALLAAPRGGPPPFPVGYQPPAQVIPNQAMFGNRPEAPIDLDFDRTFRNRPWTPDRWDIALEAPMQNHMEGEADFEVWLTDMERNGGDDQGAQEGQLR